MDIYISLSALVPKRKLVMQRSRNMLVNAEKNRQLKMKEASSAKDTGTRQTAMKAAQGMNKKIERLRSQVRADQAKVSLAQQIDQIDNQIAKAKNAGDSAKVKTLNEQKAKLDERMKGMKPIPRPKAGRKLVKTWRYPANS